MKRTVSPGRNRRWNAARIKHLERASTDDLPSSRRLARVIAYLPARDADRTSRHRATWRLAPRGGNSGINRTQYANPGRNPSMKTRYSASACRLATSSALSPAQSATSPGPDRRLLRS